MITHEEAWHLATYWSDVRYHVKQLENKVGWDPWVESIGYTIMGPADSDFRKLRDYLTDNTSDTSLNLLALASGTIRDICDIACLDAEDYTI